MKKITKQFKVAKDPLKFLISEDWLKSDDRLLLWVSLGKNERSKLSIYLNQPNQNEANLLACMLLEERQNNVFAVDDADAIISNLLDSKLYDKIYECALYQAENNALKTSEDRLAQTNNDIRSLKNYKVHLDEEIKNFERQGKTLSTQIRDLKKKNQELVKQKSKIK